MYSLGTEERWLSAEECGLLLWKTWIEFPPPTRGNPPPPPPRNSMPSSGLLNHPYACTQIHRKTDPTHTYNPKLIFYIYFQINNNATWKSSLSEAEWKY